MLQTSGEGMNTGKASAQFNVLYRDIKKPESTKQVKRIKEVKEMKRIDVYENVKLKK